MGNVLDEGSFACYIHLVITTLSDELPGPLLVHRQQYDSPGDGAADRSPYCTVLITSVYRFLTPMTFPAGLIDE